MPERRPTKFNCETVVTVSRMNGDVKVKKRYDSLDEFFALSVAEIIMDYKAPHHPRVCEFVLNLGRKFSALVKQNRDKLLFETRQPTTSYPKDLWCHVGLQDADSVFFSWCPIIVEEAWIDDGEHRKRALLVVLNDFQREFPLALHVLIVDTSTDGVEPGSNRILRHFSTTESDCNNSPEVPQKVLRQVELWAPDALVFRCGDDIHGETFPVHLHSTASVDATPQLSERLEKAFVVAQILNDGAQIRRGLNTRAILGANNEKGRKRTVREVHPIAALVYFMEKLYGVRHDTAEDCRVADTASDIASENDIQDLFDTLGEDLRIFAFPTQSFSCVLPNHVHVHRPNNDSGSDESAVNLLSRVFGESQSELWYTQDSMESAAEKLWKAPSTMFEILHAAASCGAVVEEKSWENIEDLFEIHEESSGSSPDISSSVGSSPVGVGGGPPVQAQPASLPATGMAKTDEETKGATMCSECEISPSNSDKAREESKEVEALRETLLMVVPLTIAVVEPEVRSLFSNPCHAVSNLIMQVDEEAFLAQLE